ncbi:hypothetical protein DL93DRAFT_262021 [Clavulina sp. PMI_390]|nr:hypothetical protein DL93DRAFT_262021 [Clavulina sp. PMI_390]
MRANYEQYGVEEYYKKVGGASNSYRNPHFPAVKNCLWVWLNLWWKNEILARAETPRKPVDLTLFDLAAGSGEATIAVQEWWQNALKVPASNIDSNLSPVSQGSSNLSASASPSAFIPPAIAARRLRVNASSGVALTNSDRMTVVACDPYTSEAYLARTGLPCEALSFKDVSLGNFPKPAPDPQLKTEVEEMAEEVPAESEATPLYDMIVCSFALHLLENPSEIWSLFIALSPRAKWLIVLEPHKKPEIKSGWGWELWDAETWVDAESSASKEILRERVHCRIFRSTHDNFSANQGGDVE